MQRRRRPHDDLLSALITARATTGYARTNCSPWPRCCSPRDSRRRPICWATAWWRCSGIRHSSTCCADRPTWPRRRSTELLAVRQLRPDRQAESPCGTPGSAKQRFARGRRIIVCLGAANRDPERYPHPDRLDLGRADGAPLSFGAGVHYCLGAALARLEGQVAFPALIERFRHLRIEGDLRHRASMTVRGYSRIPVSLGATG